jgi:hypothetical protein
MVFPVGIPLAVLIASDGRRGAVGLVGMSEHAITVTASASAPSENRVANFVSWYIEFLETGLCMRAVRDRDGFPDYALVVDGKNRPDERVLRLLSASSVPEKGCHTR